MKTISLIGHVHFRRGYDGEDEFAVFNHDLSDVSALGYVLVGTHPFEFTIPDDFNPVSAQVSALNKELDEANDAHMEKVRNIKGRIAQLLCIENNSGAV